MRSAFVLLGCAGVLPGALAAQTLAGADSLLALGDTSGAIAVYEVLVKRNLRDTEAHYRAGSLYMTRHVPGSDLSPNRRAAEEHFRYATRFEPDSAKYWLALADAYRSEDIVTARARVGSFLGRARRAAERAGTAHEMAAVAYRQARAAWDSYEYFGRRYIRREAGGPATGSGPSGAPGIGASWKDVMQYFTETLRPVPGAGADQLAAAEAHLRTSLAHAPGRLDAAGLLVVALGEQNRWEEGAALTRRLVRTAPDSGRAWALHGLTLARTGRWREAQAAFDTAFARMTDAERAPFLDLGQIMREADRIRFRQTDVSTRRRLDSLYWRVAQPLALTDANEVQAEFYARLVYALHRWSDPWRGYRGAATDMGTVYVAYGPPDIWTSTSWVYVRPQFVFSFYRQAGFSRSHFAGESEWVFRQARILSPARFDNVPLVRSLDTIPAQTARFRGPADSTAVAIFGAIPLRRMTDSVAVRDLPLASGAIVTDGAGREVARDRRDGSVSGVEARELRHRSWRLTLNPGEYLLRVEAHLPTLARGARGTYALDVGRFPRVDLALSDLVVAQRVAPRDSAASRWDEFLIEPNAGRFAPGDPMGLLWEVYNLTPDSTGVARYDVELWVTVDAIERRGWLAQFLGGVADAAGLTDVGDDRVTLRYRRDEPLPAHGVVTEHLMLDLKDAPAGRYVLGVSVTDRATGAGATAERVFTVGAEPVRR